MNFKWFITFTVVTFNAFHCTIAIPFFNADMAFEFFAKVADVRKNLTDTDANELVGQLFDWIKEISQLEFNTKEIIIEEFNKPMLLEDNEKIAEIIKEYKENVIQSTLNNIEILETIQEQIINKTWDSFDKSGQMKATLLRFSRNHQQSLPMMIRQIHKGIRRLMALKSLRLIHDPLKKCIEHMNVVIPAIDAVLEPMDNLDIIRIHRFLNKNALPLFHEYSRSLTDAKTVMETELKIVLKKIQDANALRGGQHR
ncbi:hypothetical protein BdWA1_003362 [Babesia duncani]|uniref:Uncharacterized protein n=1 Tax=Babesia duncani TaxID=323732 RepID=A0AAD9PII1_9APIC|nr:hypothetical protein BdWA1_003814 [Babesia duncani]KAK2195062.1 hypothetical protein BdWA1_003362 [Babesia duncani]